MITDLAGAISEVAPFAESYEFSVEIDPNEIDDARLDALAAAGMNRASIGVQDFDPAIQETIGRIQSYEITKAAVMVCGRAGFALSTPISCTAFQVSRRKKNFRKRPETVVAFA